MTHPQAQGEPYIHTRNLPDDTFLASTVSFLERREDKTPGWFVDISHRHENIINDPNIYFCSTRLKTLGPFKKESEAKKIAIQTINSFVISNLSTEWCYVSRGLDKEVSEWK